MKKGLHLKEDAFGISGKGDIYQTVHHIPEIGNLFPAFFFWTYLFQFKVLQAPKCAKTTQNGAVIFPPLIGLYFLNCSCNICCFSRNSVVDGFTLYRAISELLQYVHNLIGIRHSKTKI